MHKAIEGSVWRYKGTDVPDWTNKLCMVMDSDINPHCNGEGHATLLFEDGRTLETKVRRVEGWSYELVELPTDLGSFYKRAETALVDMRNRLKTLRTVEEAIKSVKDMWEPFGYSDLIVNAAVYWFTRYLSTIKVSAYKPSGKWYMSNTYQVYELSYTELQAFIKRHFNFKHSGYIVVTEVKDFDMSQGFYEFLWKTDELYGNEVKKEGDNE